MGLSFSLPPTRPNPDLVRVKFTGAPGSSRTAILDCLARLMLKCFNAPLACWSAGAPGSARAAILNFLASAEPHELRPLLELFLAPLSAAFVRPAGEAGQRELEALVGQDDPDAYRCGMGGGLGRLGRTSGCSAVLAGMPRLADLLLVSQLGSKCALRCCSSQAD